MSERNRQECSPRLLTREQLVTVSRVFTHELSQVFTHEHLVRVFTHEQESPYGREGDDFLSESVVPFLQEHGPRSLDTGVDSPKNGRRQGDGGLPRTLSLRFSRLPQRFEAAPADARRQGESADVNTYRLRGSPA